ncbi:MAG: hypothetical protein WD904_06190 [Dehalococcoidia bacterium]
MRIACVHIPRFAVEAERLRRKDIGARLVLIGEGTVLDCSLGAEAMKVSRGMRMSEAIGLCPRATVLPPDTPYYERLFNEALDLLETLSPHVQSAEPGTAFVALDGLQSPEARVAEDIIAGLHRRLSLMPSVGLATGKFTARVAATNTRPGTVRAIVKGEESAFLAPLPVDHLPAADAMRWRLGMLGIGSIGEFARLPTGAVQAQFGSEGVRCWDLARGIDKEPLVARLREETVVRRLQMPALAVTLDAILIGIEKLVHATYAVLPGGRWVRKAVIRGSFDGGGSWELAVPFREALSDPRNAWFAIKTAIARHPPERPLEELEVELIGLSGESGKQASMFEGKGKLWRQVEEAVRQLEAQQSDAVLGKVIALDPSSRIPERRAALADFESK